jgi:serine/threonine protein kinase
LKNSSDNSITEENKNLVTKAGSALAVTTDIGSNSSFSFASDVYQKREANVEMKRSISADSALSDEMAAMVCENRYSNDYEEYKQLGRGGFGAVYACKNRLDGRKYAIKKIRLSSAKHMEKQLHKVLREVKILARLDHKNIVRYFQAWIESVDPESSYQIVYGSPKNEDSFAEEFSETTGATSYDTSANASSPTKSLPTEYDLILYIQMQYCSQTLKEYINDPNRKVDLAEILGITQQIALGTQHIHQSGLIHRDLKPENVFFHEKEVKLGDFGLSRAVESDEADGFFSEEFDGHSMPVLESTNHSSEKSDSTVLDARNQKVARDVRRRKSTLRLGGGGFYKSLSPGSRSRSHSLSIKYSATGIGGKGELTSQIGTFTYASPEQIDGGEYNSSTDMFSLGVILFEMCHLPFSTGMERMVTISNAREGVYGTYWESLSKSNPGIATLLNQLLSTTPSKRPTAANVVETCEMLKSQILNTAADSKRNELEAENKRLKALVARYSGDYNDDGSDVYQSVAESGPRVISRNTPVNILPTAAGNTTSLDMSESSVDNETRKVLARMNTM